MLNTCKLNVNSYFIFQLNKNLCNKHLHKNQFYLKSIMLLIKRVIYKALLIHKTNVSKKFLFTVLILILLHFFFSIDTLYLYGVLFLNSSFFILADIFIKKK